MKWLDEGIGCGMHGRGWKSESVMIVECFGIDFEGGWKDRARGEWMSERRKWRLKMLLNQR